MSLECRRVEGLGVLDRGGASYVAMMRRGIVLLMLMCAAVASGSQRSEGEANFWRTPYLSGAAHLTSEPRPPELLGNEPPDSRLPPGMMSHSSPPASSFAELMRPTFQLGVERQAETSRIALSTYSARMQIPIYPIFGPPPPFINFGFSYIDLNAPEELGLPADLYDYSLGFSWMRPITKGWMLRLMFSTAAATDGKNDGSDMWQFRGGVFATYQPDEEWTWIFGALALGRNDLPVVPALGAIWQPHPGLRLDLTLPKPKIAFLLADRGARQQWGYVGSGFNGGTWAFHRSGQVADQLTFRDWRVVLGWETTPARPPGMRFARGRKLAAEVGFVFARKFEFESGLPDLRLDGALMLRVQSSF